MKTLRRKDTKEFITYQGGYMFSSEIPTILAETATLIDLKKYHDDYFSNLVEDEINWDNYEIVNIEIKIIE